MSGALDDWAAVSAVALALPGTEERTYYGGPAVAVAANGRVFVTPSREPDSFCLHIDADHKAMMLDIDPDRFWQTAHYEGWPAVLVRYGPTEGAADWIERAKALAEARKPARKR